MGSHTVPSTHHESLGKSGLDDRKQCVAHLSDQCVTYYYSEFPSANSKFSKVSSNAFSLVTSFTAGHVRFFFQHFMKTANIQHVLIASYSFHR